MGKSAYIPALMFAAAVFSGCGDKTVCTGPISRPVKATEIVIPSTRQVLPLSDGSRAAVVEIGETDCKAVAKIARDGSFTLSDTISDVKYLENMCVNSSGEFILYKYLYKDGDNFYQLYKLDQNGRLIQETETEYVPVVLLNDGGIAYFKREYVSEIGQENLVMRIIGKTFKYVFEKDFACNNVFPFEDKLFTYDTFTGEYYVFKTDGSYIGSGSLNNLLDMVSYIDGYLYAVSYGGVAGPDRDNDTGVFKWFITKMDTSGNVIFSTEIDVFSVFSYFSRYDGKLIVTGSVTTDYEKDEGYGAIFLIDENDGTHTETVALDYSGCDVLPVYVSPDNKGGYDVYAVRRNDYDEVPAYETGFSHIYGGSLFIYHVSNLHELEVK